MEKKYNTSMLCNLYIKFFWVRSCILGSSDFHRSLCFKLFWVAQPISYISCDSGPVISKALVYYCLRYKLVKAVTFLSHQRPFLGI
jgi:hypothetical protein